MASRTADALILENLSAAKLLGASRDSQRQLRKFTKRWRVSVVAGDAILLDGKWYVTHAGLLRLAAHRRCSGIHIRPITRLCDPSGHRWTFKATVLKSPTCSGFDGYGDADVSNTSDLVRGAEMRVAETRAVNRALRKAYGIGICSVEELGSFSGALPPAGGHNKQGRSAEPANGNGHHPLRDRLCLLIRQHHLDASLVKAYAADYCDVAELRQASRAQVVTFIKHLDQYAQNDREALLCQLNSYAPKPVSAAPVEATPDIATTEPEKAAGVA